MSDYRFLLAKEIIQEAGRRLSLSKHSPIESKQKSGWQDIVTYYDSQIEQFIRAQIKERFGADAIVGEELPAAAGREYTWYIDPIDGTTNFVSQHHDYCISIACWQEGSPCFGLVLDVERRHLYHARKGQGAFRNGDAVSSHKADLRISEMLLTTPVVQHLLLDQHRHREAFVRLSHAVRAIRSKGAAALELCLLAAGEADIFAAMHASPWDYAAAHLILTEAGGAISTISGTELLMKGDSTVLAAGSESSLAYISGYLNDREAAGGDHGTICRN